MTEKPTAIERRHFSRIAFDSHVLVACNGEHFETQLLDISLKGALLQAPANWNPETECACVLTVELGSEDPLRIVMQGHIVHRETNQLGFRCEHIDLESISHLRRLVELNLGSEAQLERELSELIASSAH